MKNLFISSFLIVFAIISADTVTAQHTWKDVVRPENALKNMNSILTYDANYIRLKGSFTGYDESMKIIGKKLFIDKIASGNFLPVRLQTQNNEIAYRLYRLPKTTDPNVKIMMKQIGITQQGYFNVIGKPLPAFKFQDLKGNIYTPQNTKGKIIVLKAWYLACVPCVREMPELNVIRDKYLNRKDILFLSIAFDTRKELLAFSKRSSFKYEIIPVSAEFIQEQLHATGYPAHWVINKQGIAVSMSYNKSDMIVTLAQEARKK